MDSVFVNIEPYQLELVCKLTLTAFRLHLMGYEVFGVDPGQWQIDRNINNVEPGDIVQYGEWNLGNGDNHTIFVTSVFGDTITFVDCNGNGKKNTVLTASVKVTAKGGANYKSGSKTVKVKIKVK